MRWRAADHGEVRVMIEAEIKLDDDTPVATAYFRMKPAVGEYLWFGDEVRAVHGASSFFIKEIAHWVSTVWTPSTHLGEPIQKLAIYVAPVLLDAGAS
jgi:hypothetical protein